MFYKNHVFRIASLVATGIVCLAQAGHGADAPERMNPFFAFDNGTGRGRVPLEQQAQMLKELGFDGVGYTGTARSYWGGIVAAIRTDFVQGLMIILRNPDLWLRSR